MTVALFTSKEVLVKHNSADSVSHGLGSDSKLGTRLPSILMTESAITRTA